MPRLKNNKSKLNPVNTFFSANAIADTCCKTEIELEAQFDSTRNSADAASEWERVRRRATEGLRSGG